MASTISVMPHTGKKRSSTLPLRYTFAEWVAAVNATPTLDDDVLALLQGIVSRYEGALKVVDGLMAGWSISFATPQSVSRPSDQTSEQRVELVFEVTFPNANVEKHTFGVPTPDLDDDMPFPAGDESRAYPDWVAAQWSATAQGLVSDVAAWFLLYGYDGATNVSFVYADLVGVNY